MIEQLRLLQGGLGLLPAKSRGRERLRRAGLTGVTAVISQGLTIAAGLISVPLTVSYLGRERYGVWLTLNSLLNWLAISNLGFAGNALINVLAEANGQDDRKAARELVATAFWGLVGIAALLALIFALAFPLISWQAVFNAPTTIQGSELLWAVILSLASFVLMFPIGIVDAIYQSYQKGYIGNIWAMAGSVLSLIALVCVTRLHGGLPMLVVALSGVRIIVAMANISYLFGWQYPWLLPAPQAASRRSLRKLMSLGLKYLVAQLAGIGMFQSQPIIIAQILGPAQVGIFNVAQRLMTLPLMLLQMFNFPLMPAYGEAQARQDWPWIHRTLRRSLIGSTLVILCLVLPLMFLAKSIVRFWVGPEMSPGRPLVIALGLYVLIAGIVTPASVMLYGLKQVGGQAIIAVINALVTIGAGIYLTRMEGLPGMAVAMATAIFCVNLIGQTVQMRLVYKSTLLNTARRNSELSSPAL